MRIIRATFRKSRAAYTLLELLVAIAIISLLLGLLLPAIQKIRDAANRSRCANNLRQIGLGLIQYHETYQSLPPGTLGFGSDMPYLGWSGRILPFVDQSGLWDQSVSEFRAQPNPWQPTIHATSERSLQLFVCPADGRGFGKDDKGNPRGALHYLGNAGSFDVPYNGLLYYESRVRFEEISDGATHTILVGERPPSADSLFGWWYVGWGQSGDGSADFFLRTPESRRTVRTPTCPVGPYGFGPGSVDNPCDTFHFWSRHSGGANFLFADGSVSFLRYSANLILPALATRAGGEIVEVP